MEDRYSTRRGSSERENRFFSNRIRFMDLFMTFCVAAMHISYNAGREDIITNIMKNASVLCLLFGISKIMIMV